jgi:hypothetical protein
MGPVVSKNSNAGSRGVPVVVVEHAAQAFPPTDPSICEADFLAWFDNLPFEALVISLAMVIDQILIAHPVVSNNSNGVEDLAGKRGRGEVEKDDLPYAVWVANTLS